MITDEYHDFFLATAGAAGALVGLLFVAISVAPLRVVGTSASVLHQVRASSALTALVSPLVLSLIALIPETNLGWAAMVFGGSGSVFVAAAVRRLLSVKDARRSQLRSQTVLIGFLVVTVINLTAGIHLIRWPNDTGSLDWVAGAMVGSLSIGVDRAWELVGARQSGLASSLADLMGRGRTDS